VSAIVRRLQIVGCVLAAASVLGAADPGTPVAPAMRFTPTPAGTYALQRIRKGVDAGLLDVSARPVRLSTFERDKITLLTFFYTACDVPLGCPFAHGMMSALREKILHDAELRSHVRFVSISFDAGKDEPAQLRRYVGSLATDPDFEWRFLAAESAAELQPLLEGFGQDLRVRVDSQGRPQRGFDHTLKLFLIDASGIVREIYALDFLHPDVILNDMRTLRREAQRGSSASQRNRSSG
jgi:protein SCO1